MTVNVNTVTTKLNGKGVNFTDIRWKKSPIMNAIFYDWDSIQDPNSALRPKQISVRSDLLEDGYTIKWRDTDFRRQSSSLDAAASAADTTLTAKDGSIFKKGDTIFLPAYSKTHMVMGVSTNTLTISPAVPTGGYADDSVLYIVSSTIDNNGTIGGKSVYLPLGDEVTNYIQHISHQARFSQEELNKILLKYTTQGKSNDQAVKDYTADVIKEGLKEMQNDIVNAFWAGRKAEFTIDGNTHRTTGGILEFASTPADCTGSTPTEKLQKIIDALDAMQMFETTNGLSANMLVTTRTGKSKITALAMAQGSGSFVQVTEGINLNKIGMRIDVVKTILGEIPLVVDPILTQITNDANIGYVMNPTLINLVSTVNLPANKSTGNNDGSATTKLSGIMFHKDETGSKQPNSPAVINMYTNFGFEFNGSSVGMYKPLINLGA